MVSSDRIWGQISSHTHIEKNPLSASTIIMARIKSLPAELTDRVIDYLHSDKLALSACSLVCKTWVPASRYHFFQRNFVSLADDNVDAFVELLDSPASTFFGYALRLQISPRPNGYHHSVRYIFNAISHYLSRLKIKLLAFFWVEWDITGKELEILFGRFATIPALDLLNVRFSVPKQFIEFVTSFVSLERLDLYHIAFRTHDFAHTTPFTLSPLLRNVDLSLRNEGLHRFTWFLSAVQFPPLTSLSISSIDDEDLDVVQAVLQSLGPSIHYINLEFGRYGIFHLKILMLLELIIQPCASAGLRLNLMQNTNLRGLHLYGLDVTNEVCFDIVSQIASFDLEVIEFNLSTRSPNSVLTVDWNQVARVLTQPRFMKLREVRLNLQCIGRHYHDGTEGLIRQQMSRLGNILDLSVW